MQPRDAGILEDSEFMQVNGIKTDEEEWGAVPMGDDGGPCSVHRRLASNYFLIDHDMQKMRKTSCKSGSYRSDSRAALL